MKLKENIECKVLINKAGALFLRWRSLRLRRALGGQRFNNSLKLIGGLFQTDEKKGFWENTGCLLSRWTWESPQNLAGLGYSHFQNFRGRVDRVDYLGGATFATDENNSKGGGISLGSYININLDGEITGNFTDFVKNNPVYMHEYGHTLDSRRYGLSYLLAIGIPSIISAGKSKPLSNPPFSTHRGSWTEVRANQHAKTYFGQHYGVDWNAIYGTYLKWDNDLQTYVETPYTIEECYPTY